MAKVIPKGNAIEDFHQTLSKLFDATKTNINTELTFRPQHGIHMSFNRPEVKAGKIIGWGAEPYKNIWNKFIDTELYKTIKPSFNTIISEQIYKLNNFYKTII